MVHPVCCQQRKVQREQRGWQSFAPFRLDPAPDPLPVLASRRTAVVVSREVDLPMAA